MFEQVKATLATAPQNTPEEQAAVAQALLELEGWEVVMKQWMQSVKSMATFAVKRQLSTEQMEGSAVEASNWGILGELGGATFDNMALWIPDGVDQPVPVGTPKTMQMVMNDVYKLVIGDLPVEERDVLVMELLEDYADDNTIVGG